MTLSTANAQRRDAASDRLFTAFETYGGRADYDQAVADAMTELIDARHSVDDVSIEPWLERVALAVANPNALLVAGPTPVAPSTFGMVFAVSALLALLSGGAYALYRTFAGRRRRRRRR